jgi:hypothetical protein
MALGRAWPLFVFVLATTIAALALSPRLCAQSGPASSSLAKHKKNPAPTPQLDPGSVSDHTYRNKTLGFSCRIPEGWVLRTEEMNAPDADKLADLPAETAASSASVLLAAFSRPPAAKGEDVNSSILIAAESVSAYPGLKEAVQYFGPLTEVAKAQGFIADAEPYEIAIGTRALVRADFRKDVGSRVMWQSTLAMLSHGYAVSITLIGGTEDEVENLMESLSFSANGK